MLHNKTHKTSVAHNKWHLFLLMGPWFVWKILLIWASPGCWASYNSWPVSRSRMVKSGLSYLDSTLFCLVRCPPASKSGLFLTVGTTVQERKQKYISTLSSLHTCIKLTIVPLTETSHTIQLSGRGCTVRGLIGIQGGYST